MDETVKNLKKVYQYGKEYKGCLIVFVILSCIFIVINVVFPILSAKQLLLLTDNDYMQLIGISGVILGISLLSAYFQLILKRNTQVFFRGTTKNIQMAAAKELLKIRVEDIDKESTGTFIQRINNDASEMSKVFTRGLGYLTNVLTDIGVFIAVLIVDKWVFLYFLTCSIILTILHYVKTIKVNEADVEFRLQGDKTGGLIAELVRGIRDIKMLYAKRTFLKEVDKNIDELSYTQFNMRNIEMKYNCVVTSIRSLMEFGLVLLLVFLLKEGKMEIAIALVLYNYKHRVLGNLIEYVGKVLEEIKTFNLSCTRVFSIIENDTYAKETFGEGRIRNIEGNFEFNDVYFSYGDNLVLKGLSFKIEENSTVAFVGKSGAGKTTIFSLLCRLYDTQAGMILIDGYNIRDLSEKAIRDNITIISQNPYIFNMSIRDNLRIVKEDLSESEMIDACKNACLHDFILGLPNGYDTVVGEGGITLSGGQRQRLAIARAFVQKTKIILFDEATSALDNETQSAIHQAINNMKDKYTIMIIAHRLSTIVGADKIMVIDDGKIIASGKHKQLLDECKFYKRLYDSELVEKNIPKPSK